MKRIMINNSIKFMAVAVCIALSCVSCQNDSETSDNEITLFPEFQALTETRAQIVSGDYDSYTPQNGDKIQAFTYDAQPSEKYGNYRSGLFSFNNGQWGSSVGCENTHTIDIYSIMPSNIAQASMSDATGNGVLALNGLKIISDKDVLYSVAAAKTEAGLYNNSFTLENVRLSGDNNNPEDKVWFAMNHLYAKANLSFKGDQNYLNLRTIRIKKVSIITTTGISVGSSIDFNTDVVTLNDEYEESEISIDMPVPASGTTYDLTTSYHDFGSFYFFPKANVPISVKVTYDVLDGETVTRENQTATNDKLVNLANLASGKSYDIKINVSPTYLYVLTDEDGELELTITNE